MGATIMWLCRYRHVGQAVANKVSHRWRMPKWQDGDTVDLFIFRVYHLILPNYRISYYDFILKWFTDVRCNWCVSLDIALIFASVFFNSHVSPYLLFDWLLVTCGACAMMLPTYCCGPD